MPVSKARAAWSGSGWPSQANSANTVATGCASFCGELCSGRVRRCGRNWASRWRRSTQRSVYSNRLSRWSAIMSTSTWARKARCWRGDICRSAGMARSRRGSRCVSGKAWTGATSRKVSAKSCGCARALVYALLLDPRADLRDFQLTRLKGAAQPQDFAETLRLVAPVQALPDTHRLPLLDLAMPALRQMSPRQHRAFRVQVEGLMIADQQLSLFEYTLRCVLHRHLDAQFLPQHRTRPVQNSPQKLAHPVATLLALLAWEGQPEPEQATRAFDAGMRGYIGGDHTHRLPPREECSLAKFDAALQTLDQSVPAIKRRIVVACTACILANQRVTVREAELLRAICDTLDCPLPPLP